MNWTLPSTFFSFSLTPTLSPYKRYTHTIHTVDLSVMEKFYPACKNFCILFFTKHMSLYTVSFVLTLCCCLLFCLLFVFLTQTPSLLDIILAHVAIFSHGNKLAGSITSDYGFRIKNTIEKPLYKGHPLSIIPVHFKTLCKGQNRWFQTCPIFISNELAGTDYQ